MDIFRSFNCNRTWYKNLFFPKWFNILPKASWVFAKLLIWIFNSGTGISSSLKFLPLVLLNGIAINDQSTTNGAYDFGQDFMSNVQYIEIYKGSAGHHFGADAIGGAINIVTDIDWENKIIAHKFLI